MHEVSPTFEKARRILLVYDSILLPSAIRGAPGVWHLFMGAEDPKCQDRRWRQVALGSLVRISRHEQYHSGESAIWRISQWV